MRTIDVVLATVAALLATAPAIACQDSPAHLRAMRDQARPLERQAESLRQLERVEKDKLKLLDRQAREQR